MNVLQYLSPLRIEIRSVPTHGAEASVPWYLLGTAQTQGQAEDMVKRHKIPAAFETRIIPNDPLAVLSAEVKDTPATLLLVEQYGVENLTLRRELNAAKAALESAKKELGQRQPHVDEPAAVALKKPFAVGQTIRDIHTGVALRVTHDDEPHPQIGNPERGFKFVNLTNQPGDADHTGFVPFKSAGSFEKIEDDAKPVAKPTHAEHPTPAAAKILEAVATKDAHAPRPLIAHAAPNKPRAARPVTARAAAQPGRAHKPAHAPAHPAKKHHK